MFVKRTSVAFPELRRRTRGEECEFRHNLAVWRSVWIWMGGGKSRCSGIVAVSCCCYCLKGILSLLVLFKGYLHVVIV